ncbi:Glucosylglycerate synthase [bacterium HR11]|nr:Glucosylglycerate synthase [bacterium HR11]
MRFSTALRDSARRRLERLGRADIVVGIPSYNTAATVGHVLQTAVQGLQTYFPDCLGLVLVADGGSVDDTREAAEEVRVDSYNVETLVTIYRGLPGKGTAVRAILEAAEFLQARACVLLDADLRSVTPEWIRNLAEPVLERGYDFIAPYYRRYKYDGTITNTIVYNLTRALYGLQIRQPIGGDFALSQTAVRRYLEHDVWETDVARFGVDAWLTVTAIVHRFRIGQARLGTKVHDVKDPAEHLGPMFRQVVGTVFTLMQTHEAFWKSVRGSQPVEILGEEPPGRPEPFSISMEPLLEAFRLGVLYFGPLWQNVLDPPTYHALLDLAYRPAEEFRLPIETWVRCVYAFAVTYKNWPRHKGKLLDIMLPLYNARVASLINELADVPDAEAEAFFDAQAAVFEALKDELVRRWDDPQEAQKWKAAAPTGPRRAVVLIGAGPTARTVARYLSATRPVWLVDRNRENCEEAARAGLQVVEGDALRREVLETAHAGEAALLIAMTPNDEVNVLSTRLARRDLAVPTVFVLEAGDRPDELREALRGAQARGFRLGAFEVQDWDWWIEHGRTTETVLVVQEATTPEQFLQNLTDRLFMPIAVIRGSEHFFFWEVDRLEPSDRVLGLAVAEP